MKSVLALGSLLALLLASLATPTLAAPDYPGGPDLIVDAHLACSGATFRTIQAAVDAATPGTKIRVCPGTYTEDVLIRVPLKLVAKPLGRAVIHGSIRIDGDLPPSSSFLGGDDVRLEGFVVDATGHDTGILVYMADRVDVRNNSIAGAANAGISLVDSGDVTVRNNTSSHNPGHGIALNGMVRTAVKHNITNDNGGDGIHQQEGEFNNYDTNTSDHNGANGISICYDANFDRIERNRANNNRLAGIAICGESVRGITIKSNTLRQNTTDAIDETVGTGTAGTNNTWTRNKCTTSTPAGLCIT
jgi:parallel beta-helix repeat protein